MSIITVTTIITRRYLERKTKSELAQMYLDLLDKYEHTEKYIRHVGNCGAVKSDDPTDERCSCGLRQVWSKYVSSI